MVIMMPKRPFDLVYAPVTKEHLRAIEPKYYSLIRNAIERVSNRTPLLLPRKRGLGGVTVFLARFQVHIGACAGPRGRECGDPRTWSGLVAGRVHGLGWPRRSTPVPLTGGVSQRPTGRVG